MSQIDPHLLAFVDRMEALEMSSMNGPCQTFVYSRINTYAKLTARMIGELTLDEVQSCIDAARTEYKALEQRAIERSRGKA